MNSLYSILLIFVCFMTDISSFFALHYQYFYTIPMLFVMYIVNQHTLSQLIIIALFLHTQFFLIYGAQSVSLIYIAVGFCGHFLFSRSIYAHASAFIATYTGFLIMQIYGVEPYIFGLSYPFFYTIKKLIVNLLIGMIFSLTVKTQGKLGNRP